MDMVLVNPVRSGAEHRTESIARRRPHRQPYLARYFVVGRTHGAAILEPQAADVEGVCVAVLAGARARNAVARPTIIRIDVLDRADGPEHGHCGDKVLAYEVDDRLRHLATQLRRRV